MRSSVLRHGWLCHNKQPLRTLILYPTDFKARCRHFTPFRTTIQRRRDVSISAEEIDDFAPGLDEDAEEVRGIAVVPAQSVAQVDTAAEYNYKSAKGVTKQTATFERWVHESDVTAEDDHGPRLVDNPDHHFDFRLWIRLLELKSRLEGHKGTWKIYDGMVRRDVDLPTDGPYAQSLWDPIIAAAIDLNEVDTLLFYVLDLYKRTGHRYENLYPMIVRHYLPTQWKAALRYDRDLRLIDLPAPGGLRSAITPLALSKGGSDALQKLYMSHPEPNLYDRIISSLSARMLWGKAFIWHLRLIENHDYPSSTLILDPLMRQLFLSGQLNKLERMRQCFPQAGLVEISESASQVSAESLRLNTNGIAASTPKSVISGRPTMSDKFCARAFATRAFTPTLVIRTLRAFGVRSIGPLALRELAVRCRSLIHTYKAGEGDLPGTLAREVNAQLDNLQASGISVQDTAFTTFVSRLARDGKGVLLESTLSSDQHPDVYEDANLQLLLLRSYIRMGDWLQIHRTLTLLTLSVSNAAIPAWNMFLVAVIDSDSPDRHTKILQMLRMMRMNRIYISTATLRHSYFHLRSRRKPGHQPMREDQAIPELNFITRMWIDAVNSGVHVPARCWDHIIRQYGQLNLLIPLERLCLWLAYNYSPKVRSNFRGFRRRSKAQLNLLFPPWRQRAMIEWYMKSLQDPHLSPGESDESLANPPSLDTVNSTKLWARGLVILRTLKAHGLLVDVAAVRAAIRNRMIILFGAGLSKRPHNRVAAKNNPYTFRGMVRYMQMIWKPVGPLFPLPQSILRARDDAAEELSVERVLRRVIMGQAIHKIVPGQRDRRMRMRLRYRGVYGTHAKFPSEEELEAAIVAGAQLGEDSLWHTDRDRPQYRSAPLVKKAEKEVVAEGHESEVIGSRSEQEMRRDQPQKV